MRWDGFLKVLFCRAVAMIELYILHNIVMSGLHTFMHCSPVPLYVLAV